MTASGKTPVADVLTEQGRLNTFRGWPHSAAVEPTSLAKAGFFYLGQADRVRCAFCGGTLKNWQHGDDPWQEHQNHFAHCLFVQRQDFGNVPATAVHTQLQIQSNPAQSGTQRQAVEVTGVGRLNPHHPEYQTMDSRRSSFQGWPQNLTQKPEDLADAGFFYQGQGDQVRCFCCGGALRNWEPDDTPWQEHARWFPRCPYVMQQKGRGFVTEILRRSGSLGRAQVTSSPASSPCRAGVGHSTRLSEVMQSETVKEVLDMGFTPEQVQNAVLRVLTYSGGRKPELSQLVNVLVGDDKHNIKQGAGEELSGPQQTGMATPHSGGDDRTMCKICMDREVAVTFLPCGHLVCCTECSRQVKECPVCRKLVKASIRTYLT